MASEFIVTLECGNCGNEWDTQHEPRTKVVESSAAGAVLARASGCEQISVEQCDCCSVLGCPVCELRRDVTVADRHPVEEEGDDV